MKTYTLEDLRLVFECKHYLTRDRFIHYFTTRFNKTERQAKEDFKLFYEFPRGVYNEEQQILLDELIPEIIALVHNLNNTPHIPYSRERDRDKENGCHKLIYKENDAVKEFVFNFYTSNDVIDYAALLSRNIEIIDLLPLCTSVTNDKEKQLIFEGDFFDTNDKFWGNKSNVYLAQAKNTFVKLNYIKGKGYLINGALNIDEDREYNSHCLTLYSFKKMGNIVTDMHLLKDLE